jgi:hypothetical protein
MTPRSRFLLIAMSTAFGISAAGLLLGMFYDLYEVFIRHRELENILGNSIPYNKTLGAIGIAGFMLFFAFLFSAMAGKKQGNHGK